MRSIPWSPFLVLALLLVCGSAVEAGDKRHGVGVGYVIGDFDSEDLPKTVITDGGAVFGKIGITENWGVFLSYRHMRNDEELPLYDEATYQAVTVDGIYMFRPGKTFRPHLRFGLAAVDLEFESASLPTVADRGIGLSLGGGFEAGSQRVAFFLDIDNTLVDLEGAGGKELFGFQDLAIGVILKF